MTATTASTLDPLPRTRLRSVLEVIACSLLVTMLAAIVAIVAALATDVRWSLAFVVGRWIFVAALLVTPLVQQVASRMGATWQLPYALRTPATALLLTVESIAFDIASARLG